MKTTFPINVQQTFWEDVLLTRLTFPYRIIGIEKPFEQIRAKNTLLVMLSKTQYNTLIWSNNSISLPKSNFYLPLIGVVNYILDFDELFGLVLSGNCNKSLNTRFTSNLSANQSR